MMMFWNKKLSALALKGVCNAFRARRRKTPLFHVLLAAFILVVFLSENCAAGRSPHLVGFQGETDGDSLPEGWEHVSFLGKNTNEFELMIEDARPVLRVRSLNSISALLARPDVDLHEFSRLVWRWKINRVVGMAREDKRDRNDSAARVRVVFRSDRSTALPALPLVKRLLELRGVETGPGEPAGRKIDYIWGNHFPAGTVMKYPGAKEHAVIFLRSGNGKAGRWVWEERDLLKDYEECFGGRPEGLAGILVLSDTDQTNEGVIAFFGSVVLMGREDHERP